MYNINRLYVKCGVLIMDWMTTKEAAELWEISTRRVQVLCDGGRVDGASKFGNAWVIPKGAKKPKDGRGQNGKTAKNKEI